MSKNSEKQDLFAVKPLALKKETVRSLRVRASVRAGQGCDSPVTGDPGHNGRGDHDFDRGRGNWQ